MPRKYGPTWQPNATDYRQVFREQNPWHDSGDVPTAWAYPIERPLAKCLWPRLVVDEPRRFQLVLGPRRVGKTTTLYQTVRHLLAIGTRRHRVWWLRMDHPLLMRVDLGLLVKAAMDVA